MDNSTPHRHVASSLLHPARVILLTSAFSLVTAAPTYAQTTGNPMADVLCVVLVMILQGTLGRGLATAAILMLGVGATLGKTSWGLAVTVAVGVSVMFGAVALALALAGLPDVCGAAGFGNPLI